jgi:hypothetical protein
MPWQDNPGWDEQISGSDVVAIDGEFLEHRSTVSLRRPGQMVCDKRLWEDPRDNREEELRELLRGAGADETRNAPRLERDDRRIDAADRLGLTLLNVEDEAQPALFRDGRRLVPDALEYNHVMVAGPQRFGGDAVPVPLGELSVDIPDEEAVGPWTVAVLDTGFVANTPIDVRSDSDIEPASAGSPAEGHGTMVAGVLRRFAPTATLVVKQVLNMPLGEADELEVADALNALPPEIDVVNASFGGPAADGTRMVALQRALDELGQEKLVVAAAGNEGLPRRHYMAAFKGVVAVGSAAVQDGGPAICFYSNRGPWVDLSTQGSDIETLGGPDRPVVVNGTSFATPKITATILNVATQQDISPRHAASWLMHQSGGPAIAGGGTFVDIGTP